MSPDRRWRIADRPGFEAAFAVLAAQRHAKVIGIFTRLCRRDGKAGYLVHIPRVWRLLERALGHPALAAGRRRGSRPTCRVEARRCSRMPAGRRMNPAGGPPGHPRARRHAASRHGPGGRSRVADAAADRNAAEAADRRWRAAPCSTAPSTILKKPASRTVVVNAHYLAEKVEGHVRRRSSPRIVLSVEEDRLETGGGVAQRPAAAGRRAVFRRQWRRALDRRPAAHARRPRRRLGRRPDGRPPAAACRR